MSRSKKRSGTSTWAIETSGVADVTRAMRILAETDAPFVRAALGKSGELLRNAAIKHTHPSIASKLEFVGVQGKAGSLRAVVRTKHAGARSREFGRKWYYRGYNGRAMKSGQRFKVAEGRGQKAQPFLGVIKGDKAVADVKPEVERLLTQAFEDEFERIANGDS